MRYGEAGSRAVDLPELGREAFEAAAAPEPTGGTKRGTSKSARRIARLNQLHRFPVQLANAIAREPRRHTATPAQVVQALSSVHGVALARTLKLAKIPHAPGTTEWVLVPFLLAGFYLARMLAEVARLGRPGQHFVNIADEGRRALDEAWGTVRLARILFPLDPETLKGRLADALVAYQQDDLVRLDGLVDEIVALGSAYRLHATLLRSALKKKDQAKSEVAGLGESLMPKADPVVPREALKPGIAKCLEVAGWRLREASGLLSADPAPTVTAAIFFTFGIEEFGKAILLRRAFETGEPTVKIAGFYDHRVKIEAAAEHIPEERLLLHRGAFQRNFVQKNAFDVGNPADFEARLDGLYVDWGSKGWAVGVRVDPSVLSDNIAAVADIIQQKQVEWQDLD